MSQRAQVKLKVGPLPLDPDDSSQHDPLYTVCHSDGSRSPRKQAIEISSGGSAVVYRVQYKDTLDRALKLLDPRPDLAKNVDSERFHHSFLNEQHVLQSLTHQNIVKLLDFGSLKIANRSIPYLVMDYVDGQSLDEVLATDLLTASDLMTLFAQLIDGVAYLHDKRVMHCDLKPANVMLQQPLRGLHVTILDLGVAHSIVETQRLAVNKTDVTYFFGTEKYTIPQLHDYLNREIPRDLLADFFPKQDLYSLGQILGDILEREETQDKVRRGLGDHGFSALLTVKERLISADRGGGYKDAGELQADWKKLNPTYLAPLGVNELSLAPGSRASITSSQGKVNVTDRILTVVNHPLFQRLHGIPQLEFLYLVYTGATQTRFDHSLNAFATGRTFVAHLLNDTRFRLRMEPADVEALLFALLLHDLGHYPLSHMFEDFVEAAKRAGSPMSRTVLADDEVTQAFCLDLSTSGHAAEGTPLTEARLEAAEIGRSVLDDHDNSFATVLREEVGDLAIERLFKLRNYTSETEKVLGGVIDAACDADKVAYLASDSRATGVKFGLGMDIDGLVKSLIYPADQDIANCPRGLLGIRESGVAAAESIVMARYWMIRRVYWHHLNRSIMAMCKFVIGKLLQQGALDFLRYLRSTLTSGQTGAIQFLIREYEAAVKGRTDIITSCPLRGLADYRRFMYRRLATLSSRPGSGNEQIHSYLVAVEPLSDSHILASLRETISWLLPNRLLPKEGEVLLDIPWKRREEDIFGVYVYDDRFGQPIAGLFEYSPILSSFRQEFDAQTKLCRVVIHPRLYSLLEENDKLTLAEEAVVKNLEDLALA